MLHAIFIDSRLPIAKERSDEIVALLEKGGLRSKTIYFESSDEITTELRDPSNNYNTYIAVGDDASFDLLIAAAKFLGTSPVLGFIPLHTTELSKKLGIKDYKDSCQTILQRRLTELNIYSINSEFFLFHKTLKTKDEKSNADIRMVFDKKLEVNVSSQEIIITNQSDMMHTSRLPISIEAFSSLSLSKNSHSSLFEASKRRFFSQLSGDKRLQLRMPGKQVVISCQSPLYSSDGKAMKSPITVGLHCTPIRLIVKRGHENQSSDKEVLIS